MKLQCPKCRVGVRPPLKAGTYKCPKCRAPFKISEKVLAKLQVVPQVHVKRLLAWQVSKVALWSWLVAVLCLMAYAFIEEGFYIDVQAGYYDPPILGIIVPIVSLAGLTAMVTLVLSFFTAMILWVGHLLGWLVKRSAV